MVLKIWTLNVCCVMLAQITLISYHTEAFVKTEVGCTVIKTTQIINKIKTLALRNPDLNQFLPNFILNLPLFSGLTIAEKEQQIQKKVGVELI